MKPKIPCLPGFVPVKMDVQAVGEIGGMVEQSSPLVPCSLRWRKPGRLPCSDHCSIGAKFAPSIPTTIILEVTKLSFSFLVF
jgi:hypothetical protein